MAHVVKKLHPGMMVFACDTFEGMPQTDKNVDAHTEGDFSDVDLDALQARVNDLNLDNLILVKGLFETTNSDMARARRIRLAHIDCDIASAVKCSYEGVKPYMVDGGYIVFDDATHFYLYWCYRDGRGSAHPQGWAELRADLAALRIPVFSPSWRLTRCCRLAGHSITNTAIHLG
jgi:Macrocin-O-methyltransferase (TylF)